MSVTIYSDSKEITTMSSDVGYCFVEQIKTIERLIDVKCGIDAVINDEINVASSQLAIFIDSLVKRLDETNNGQFAALCVGCLQICFFLYSRIFEGLPNVPERLQPILDGSRTLRTVNWVIVALQNDDEEVALRQGVPRSDRNWVVYAKKNAAHSSRVSADSSHEQSAVGLMLLKQKRYTEALTVLRENVQNFDNEEGYYLLGLALMHNGEIEEARTTFEGVIASSLNQAYVGQAKKMIDQIDRPINTT